VVAGPKDSPKRDWHAFFCLAAVISRFGVVAVQESRRNPNALKRLLATLGPQWQVIISDVTEGSAGNGERLAFLYDSARVPPLGLVGEIVLPPAGDDLQRQFAPFPVHRQLRRGRDRIHSRVRPCAVGQEPGRAVAGGHRLRHMDAGLWQTGPTTGTPTSWCWGTSTWTQSDPLYEAFSSTGLWPPAELNTVPRTIFDDDRTQHFYDQIAWFSDAKPGSWAQDPSFPSPVPVAGWLDAGANFAVVLSGSSSCPAFPSSIEVLNSQHLKLSIATRGAQACTADMAPRIYVIKTPIDVDVSQEVTLEYGKTRVVLPPL
jgi:hypothetical protein